MESICCGTPVITFDCCGSPELVEAACGFVVEEGNTDELLACIEKIKETPLAWDIKAQQNRFDKNRCYRKYLDIYKEISEKET